jgi:hypothetical protein
MRKKKSKSSQTELFPVEPLEEILPDNEEIALMY